MGVLFRSKGLTRIEWESEKGRFARFFDAMVEDYEERHFCKVESFAFCPEDDKGKWKGGVRNYKYQSPLDYMESQLNCPYLAVQVEPEGLDLILTASDGIEVAYRICLLRDGEEITMMQRHGKRGMLKAIRESAEPFPTQVAERYYPGIFPETAGCYW